MTHVDEAAEVRHRGKGPERRLVVEGGHADLRRVAEVRRHPEVDARDLRRHHAAPEIRVLVRAEESEGHQSITSDGVRAVPSMTLGSAPLRLVLRLELECRRVDAVAKAGRLGAVVEDVAEMAVAR